MYAAANERKEKKEVKQINICLLIGEIVFGFVIYLFLVRKSKFL